MPYESIKDLPQNIQKLPEKKQRQFLAVFNQAIENGKAESEAFKLANGVLKKQGKSLDFSMSFEDIRQQLQAALKEQFSTPEKTIYPWIAQTYFSHIIAEVGDSKYYSISYVVIDGEVTFSNQGDWLEVESRQVWIEKKALEDFKAGARHSAGDSKMVQTIHDHAVSLGAMCGEEGKTTDSGNCLKAISETEVKDVINRELIRRFQQVGD
jgi:cation transport regulator ChaB